jgi:predicted transcriptional regulator
MSVQFDELRVAHNALKAKLSGMDEWMAQIASGEPFAREEFERDLNELEVLRKLFVAKTKPFLPG